MALQQEIGLNYSSEEEYCAFGISTMNVELKEPSVLLEAWDSFTTLSKSSFIELGIEFQSEAPLSIHSMVYFFPF